MDIGFVLARYRQTSSVLGVPVSIPGRSAAMHLEVSCRLDRESLLDPQSVCLHEAEREQLEKCCDGQKSFLDCKQTTNTPTHVGAKGFPSIFGGFVKVLIKHSLVTDFVSIVSVD